MVQTDESKKPSLADQDVTSTEFVSEYFSRSVVLFRDDRAFMQQLKTLVEEDLPLEVRNNLIAIYMDELLYDLGALSDHEHRRETSQLL